MYRPRIYYRESDPGYEQFEGFKNKMDPKFVAEVLKNLLIDIVLLNPEGGTPREFVDCFYELKTGAPAPASPPKNKPKAGSSRPKKTKKKEARIKLEGFDPNAPLPDEDEDSSDAMNAAMSGPAL